MNTIAIQGGNIKEVLSAAMGVLNGGGVIAYPTETFYALGARFDNQGALEKIYGLKGRSGDKPLPLIVCGREPLEMLGARLNDTAHNLISRYWPGPLTILIPIGGGLNPLIIKDGFAAVRMPGKSFALSLACTAGYPITSTSANPAAMPPALTSGEVEGYFGEGVDLIIDAGRAPGGMPSTIVDIQGGSVRIIRQGGCDIDAGRLNR